MLPVMLRFGAVKTILNEFALRGKNNWVANSFFNKVNHELLTVDRVEDFTIKPADLAKQGQYPHAHVAALNPSRAAFDFLIEKKIEVDIQKNGLWTAHYAAVCESPANLSKLNDFEKLETDTKITPLILAIQTGKDENTIHIIENLSKAQLELKDSHKRTAVHHACQYGASERVLEALLEKKAKFTPPGGWDKYTPLEYAATYNQFDVAEFVLTRVPRLNINKGDKFNRSPLLMACRNGNLRVAALLAKYGASLEQADTSGNSPLHHAAAYGWADCVKLLLKLGADSNP